MPVTDRVIVGVGSAQVRPRRLTYPGRRLTWAKASAEGEESMDVRRALIEALDTLVDALETGDLRGHLRVLWETLSGRIAPDTNCVDVCAQT